MGFNIYNKHTGVGKERGARDSERIIDPPSCQISVCVCTTHTPIDRHTHTHKPQRSHTRSHAYVTRMLCSVLLLLLWLFALRPNQLKITHTHCKYLARTAPFAQRAQNIC